MSTPIHFLHYTFSRSSHHLITVDAVLANFEDANEMVAPVLRTPAISAAGRVSTMARHLSTTAAAQRDVKRLTVFGAGSMGSGIAQVASTAGIKVTMTDVKEEALQ